ncbi:hypothetical protein [uncultured Clostridium sp.]|uniref:hypothetical protein n=1 Tax=uncultured Clostridium sp. TaxID=59620 RepID=UPI0026EC6961|nr:hypothetical protein [uncultured Clostridium sp.]
MNLDYFELLLIILSVLSTLDLFRFYISRRFNKDIFNLLEGLGADYKTEFKIKIIIEKLFVLMGIVWVLFKILNFWR